MSKHIAVVGGGISGIGAAFALHCAGARVELIESGDALGGRCGPTMFGDRPVMLGGKNIGRRYTEFRGFVAAMGDHPFEPFGINTSRIVDGRVRGLSSDNRLNGLRRVLLEMGTPRDTAKLVRYAVRARRSDTGRFLGDEYFAGLAGTADRKPLSAHFGAKMLENLIRPMTIRMNGAEPDEMYLGTFGTNIGMLDTYDQLTRGLQPVLDAFAEKVDVRLRATVRGLVVRDGRVTGLRISDGEGPAREHRYDGVVLALPAHAAAALVDDDAPTLGKLLSEVRYFPSTVVLVEYDRPVFGREVRAIALDGGPCSNIGAYGVEDRHIARYTFSGRLARPVPTPERLDGWLDETEEMLRPHLELAGATRVRRLVRSWEAAYCGYVPFHGEFLARLDAELAAVPGLTLAGDYRRGASLEACFRSGLDAAHAQLGDRTGTAA
ncbi:FAD-dependent oxidoreductase [Actinomadura chokoriensis]|uniref:FAD-dependent oxidoreductase n=1 Tax=Actinomadura chokoriensis TaxID=454156 RepID=A0ABV4R3M6_9ACTN